MLPDILFQKGNGALGRPLPGQDHYSGLVFYSASYPSGFSQANNIKKFLSVNDAINAGINMNYTDETQATASYAVTAVGANGDSISLSVNEPNGVVVLIGTYVKTAGASTVTAVGAAIAAAINAGTANHGYTAVNNVGTVTITARKGLGIFLNTGANLTVAITGAIAGTITQFTGGVGSRNAVYYYHISEFFRIQPKGVLWVGIFPVPNPYTFIEVATLQNFSKGVIRQIGVYKDSAAFSTADMTAIQSQLLPLENSHKPCIALYAGDLSGVADISTLTDLNTFNNYKVQPCIGQDFGGQGGYLFQTFGKSITTLGAQLGAQALAKVNEDIAWVEKFNMTNGVELLTIAFANGKPFTDPSITDNLLTLLDGYRYVFLRYFVGTDGSYFNKSNMACSVSSDYAYAPDNRTMDKAERGVYASLLPALSGPLLTNKDGTLSNISLAYLKTKARPNLDQMQRDSEISAYAIIIDPTQIVVTNSTVTVGVQLEQSGVARNIIVPISYTTSLS